MEDKIFEIIENNYSFFKGVNEAHIASSKEIAANIEEFITWLSINTTYDEETEMYFVTTDKERGVGSWLILDATYGYWLYNVKL